MPPVLGLDRPALLALFLLILLIAIWSRARRHDRAFARALALLLLLHAIAWLRAGPALPLHALCDALGLGLIGAMALRSRLFYPLVMAAALLVAFLSRASGALGPADMAAGSHLLARLAELALVLAFGVGAGQRLLRRDERGASPTVAERDCEPGQAGLSPGKKGRPS